MKLNKKNKINTIEAMMRIPVYIGFDRENMFKFKGKGTAMSDNEAAPLILKHINGVQGKDNCSLPITAQSYYWNSLLDTTESCNDWYRIWLINGGCVYIDLSKVEGCSPTCKSAKQLIAYSSAFRKIFNDARIKAEALSGKEIEGFDSNSDRQGNFWGNHLNTLLPKFIFERLNNESKHLITRLYIPFVASTILLTGAGKVKKNHKNNQFYVVFGDRFNSLQSVSGIQTTFQRPVFNTRNESLCTTPFKLDDKIEIGLSRLHNIPFDTLSNSAEPAAFVQAVYLQILTSLLVASSLGLYAVPDFDFQDPIFAIKIIGADISLKKNNVRLANGKEISGLQLLAEIHCFFNEYIFWYEKNFGDFSLIVPDYKEAMDIASSLIVTLITVSKQNDPDFSPFVGQTDWANKLYILDNFFSSAGDKNNFRSLSAYEKAALIDLNYHNIDPEVSINKKCIIDQGLAKKKIISDAEIAYAVCKPPEESRDWFRGNVIQKFGDSFSDIDWFKLKLATNTYFNKVISLGNPLSFTKKDVGNLEGISSPEELFNVFGSVEDNSNNNLT